MDGPRHHPLREPASPPRAPAQPTPDTAQLRAAPGAGGGPRGLRDAGGRLGQGRPGHVRRFPLLVALARKPRQVFTRELLLEQVWGYRHAADTRLVNVHVQRLRAKIEQDPEKPEVVLTVRGVGYKAGPP